MFVIWVEEISKSVRGDTIRIQMKSENGRCDAETLDLDAFVTHKYVMLMLDDVFKILVSCDIIRADKLIHEF